MNIELHLERLAEQNGADTATCREAAQELRRLREALRRAGLVAASMADRAADNPQGIQASTLTMFSEELQLALKLV